MNKLLLITAAGFALGLTAAACAAGDAAKGKEKSQTCAACHGADGNSSAPTFPRLAGQHADYLAKALTDYQKEKRKDPIMGAQAKNLSKDDIQDLAAYFSSQKGLAIRY